MQITETFFSDFKLPGRVSLGKTSAFRKVHHSASQSIKSYWTRGPSKTTVAGGALDAVSQISGVVGIGAGIATMVGSTAAFVAAVGGPQVAITAGVIGLALFVRSAYSDRESLHLEMAPLVWSLIDDKEPNPPIATEAQLEKIAGIAMGLMSDGPAQFQLMGSKLKIAEDNFEKHMLEVARRCSSLTQLNHLTNKQQIHHVIYVWKSYTRASQKQQNRERLFYSYNFFVEELKAAEDMMNDGRRQGQPIFEFMRRLIHAGNYLQCAHFINIATFMKLRSSVCTPTTTKALPGMGATQSSSPLQEPFRNPITEAAADILKNWSGSSYYRQRLKKQIQFFIELNDALLELKELVRAEGGDV